jgi:[ribosomal protein S18]-alanine N-acetyltransferase
LIKLQATSLVAAPVLAQMHKASFISHADWDEDFFQKLLTLPTTRGLIALKDETPVGFILWQQTIDMGEIITIAALPEARRSGIASSLIAGFEEQLREEGAAESLLDVSADNAPAIALYEKQGYAQVHRRPNYYQLYENGVERRVDALVLKKLLHQ